MYCGQADEQARCLAAFGQRQRKEQVEINFFDEGRDSLFRARSIRSSMKDCMAISSCSRAPVMRSLLTWGSSEFRSSAALVRSDVRGVRNSWEAAAMAWLQPGPTRPTMGLHR